MHIQQQDDGKKGRFYVEENGETLAEMTYVWAGADRFIIDHTEVDDRLRGKSAGRQMVAKAVNFARERNVKILPLCPFAKSVFDKVAEYADVLSEAALRELPGSYRAVTRQFRGTYPAVTACQP